MNFFQKRTLTKRGIKKVDALVTGFILWGVIASIYGIKKHTDVHEKTKQEILEASDKHTLGSIIRMLVFGPETVKKPSLYERITKFFR